MTCRKYEMTINEINRKGMKKVQLQGTPYIVVGGLHFWNVGFRVWGLHTHVAKSC